MNDYAAIDGWIDEQLKTVEEPGSCSTISLMHYQNGGAVEAELYTLKSGGPKWTTSHEMATLFDTIATRHARGLPGTQCFQLVATFGASGKATRFLPFARTGALNFGGASPAAGMLTSEPSGSPAGLTATATRWGELSIQGASAKDTAATQVLLALVKDLHQKNSDLQGQFGTMFNGYLKLLGDVHTQQQESAIKVIVAKRNAAAFHELLRMAPGLANAISGTEVFPMAQGDSSLIRGLLNMPPEQIAAMAQAAANAGPEQAAFAAALMQRLNQLKAQDEAEAEQLRELQREARGGATASYADAEVDAAGQRLIDPRAAVRELLEPRQLEKADGGSSNDHTSGHANGAPCEDDTLLDDLIAAAGPLKMTMLIGALASDDDALANRLRERASKRKNK